MAAHTQVLIPVFQGSINNEQVLLCDARKLHKFLDVKRRFATWIMERIKEYGFVENQDFMIISQIREKIGRGRPTVDYHLTIDTAKELSMVERNEQGRIIRRYFIECERKVYQVEPPIVCTLPGDGRYLVMVRDGVASIRDANNCSLVDLSIMDKIRRDLRTVSAAQIDLAERLRTLGGEESLTVLNQPIQLTLTAI